jgi:hypothetical protein
MLLLENMIVQLDQQATHIEKMIEDSYILKDQSRITDLVLFKDQLEIIISELEAGVHMSDSFALDAIYEVEGMLQETEQ